MLRLKMVPLYTFLSHVVTMIISLVAISMNYYIFFFNKKNPVQCDVIKMNQIIKKKKTHTKIYSLKSGKTII